MRGGRCASGRWEANESVAAGLARQAEGGQVPAGADVTGASATPEACGGPAGAAGAGRGREPAPAWPDRGRPRTLRARPAAPPSPGPRPRNGEACFPGELHDGAFALGTPARHGPPDVAVPPRSGAHPYPWSSSPEPRAGEGRSLL